MSRLRILRSRSGLLTAEVSGHLLHSAVDPQREAERLVDRLLPHVPATLIVVGPALGHLLPPIRARRPDVHILGLHLSAETARAAVHRADHEWHPGAGVPLDEFLNAALDPLETASLEVVPWQPSLAAYPEVGAAVQEGVLSFVRRAQATLVTEGGTGRRWLRNGLRNAGMTRRWRLGRSERRARACVVAAAGPSLEESMSLIRAHRGTLAVIAVSSALEALLAADLTPDLVVSTDASVYATEHLAPLVRRPGGGARQVPLVAPVSASRGIELCEPLVLVSQDDPLEALLVPDYDRLVSLPPQGTVTASALTLARRLDRWPVLLAGVDFALFDGRTHVRPHLSHLYRDAHANRLAPAETVAIESVLGSRPIAPRWRSTRSLSTYAEWLHSTIGHFAPLSALSPSPALAGVAAISERDLADLPPRYQGVTAYRLPDVTPVPPQRCVAALLDLLPQTAPELPLYRFAGERNALVLAVRLAAGKLISWYRDPSRLRWEAVDAAVRDELQQLRGAR